MTLSQEQTQPQVETVEVRAMRMAAIQQVVRSEDHNRLPRGKRITPERPRLLNRLKTQRLLLHDAYLLFVRISEAEEVHSFAAEWLLDNYYIVQQTLRLIHEDMPESYYRQLPKLANTRMAGNPRVFSLARELVVSSNASIDPSQVERFINAYQTIHPLTMGELWAVPTMLRFGLIEALTQAATVALDIQSFDESSLAEGAGNKLPPDTIIANCITSMRTMNVYDWKSFVERISLVERSLRSDPSGVYPRSDFQTRDRYRRIIEELSFRSPYNQTEIARQAIALARQASLNAMDAGSWTNTSPLPPSDEMDSRAAHVGYYLIAEGRQELEKRINYHPGWQERASRSVLQHPKLFYIGSIGVLTLLFTALAFLFAAAEGAQITLSILAAVLALIPASGLATSLMNWSVTSLLPPRLLPKLDFSEEIPAEYRTLVVIPALLSSLHEIDSLIGQMELHYLRNDNCNLAFALLTDFNDAPKQNMPGDQELIEYAVHGVEALREKYSADAKSAPGGEIFFLFNRERLWNARENAWMGWERKRGKLVELNRLLGGAGDTSFTTQVGSLKAILPVRYVITLDADTILPSGDAARLIGTLAHPLNRAVFNPQTGRVMSGYTILQPRTEIKPTSASQTAFTRIYTGDVGLDLYTHAVSDVYQDLFGEGIYVGKGIYDLPAFMRAEEGKIPENTLLSHDLLEGLLGRVGLVSDIVLYEEFPSTYQAFIRRLRRWMRGDWQLLPWLFAPSVRSKARLSAIDTWKIIDNLRRSLFAPALFLLLIAGWMWLPGSPLFWTAAVLITSGAPVITGAADYFIRRARISASEQTAPQHVAGFKVSNRDALTRWLLSLAFLPYESIIALDAILTTLVRVLFIRRNMLEWTASADVTQLFNLKKSQHWVAWQEMLLSGLLAAIVLAMVIVFNPGAVWFALPFSLLWLVSPQLTVWLGRPLHLEISPLSDRQRGQVRSLARRTWLFFEQFVGPADNWLPPDHFQESPRGTVAHRTSTTNIGLGMLTTLGAFDLGYIGLEDLVLRASSTLATLEQLQTYRGHPFNWYDTRTLQPLPPCYVSTVDSGNLAGSLITLAQGMDELRRVPLVRWENWEGLVDTLVVLRETLETIGKEGAKSTAPLHGRILALADRITGQQNQVEKWPALLENLEETAWPAVEADLMDLIDQESAQLAPQLLQSLRVWADRVRYQIASMSREQTRLAPWLPALANPPELFNSLPADSAQGAALAAVWQSLRDLFPPTLSLQALADSEPTAIELLDRIRALLTEDNLPTQPRDEAQEWTVRLSGALDSAMVDARQQLKDIQTLIERLNALAWGMDFQFLYNEQRQLFYIGYNIDAERMDNNYYDLLASEARLASLIAIAKEDVPRSHWLHLARPLTRSGNLLVLLSWSGTMFEYLMPPLLLREYPQTLLNQSAFAATQIQMQYGAENKVPWGTSESGFYYFDADQNYQYRAFGVPGLGFKRGLSDDLVIAPYASLLALPFFPHEVASNLQRLIDLDMLRDYGLYESIDYTANRLPLGQEYAIVKSFMAHHQGMILLAIDNYLQGNRMVERFMGNMRIQSVDLLLQEQVPIAPVTEQLSEQDEEAPSEINPEPPVLATPWRVPVESTFPLVNYLSNGSYSLLLTNKGGGVSHWQDRALTRWRANSTLDDWGTWLFLQDLESGLYWTVGSTLVPPPDGDGDVFFSPHKADFHSRAQGINTALQVTVPPDDDVEIRLIRLTNSTDHPRHLALTTYGELVLADQDTDRRHPAFNKMVIESEAYPDLKALIFHRRLRARSDKPIYMLHGLFHHPSTQGSETLSTFSLESNRQNFIGRDRTIHNPLAMEPGQALSGETGLVLDPIFSVRQEFVLKPHSSIEFAVLSMAADSRPAVLSLARQYQDWNRLARGFERASHNAEVEMRRLDVSSPDLEVFQKLLSTLIYPQPTLRADPATLMKNTRGQPALWTYSVSGDYPILLLTIGEREDIATLRELLRAHTFWRGRGLLIDLVILALRESNYGQEVTGRVNQLLQSTHNTDWVNRRGGIFVLSQGQVSEEDMLLLYSAARAVISSGAGPLTRQVAPVEKQPIYLPPFNPVGVVPGRVEETPTLPRPDGLEFDNAWGGFNTDGSEYIIYLTPSKERGASNWPTPAPWINVIANEKAGFWVSEAGGGYSWAANSGENRLTPWSNDPVSDVPGEAIYLRDEETAEIWSPTPLPAGDDAPYLARHGAGYSIFTHQSHGLGQELTLFTHRDEAVKVVRLKLHNLLGLERRITATYYAEWVLGVNRDQMQQYVHTTYDSAHNAILARNPYNVEFGERVAFLAANRQPHGLTADRTEFLGASGSRRSPMALKRVGLSGQTGAGLDPCAALTLHFDLKANETQEVFFLLGQGEDQADAERIIEIYQQPEAAAQSLRETRSFWSDLLSTVTVSTPDVEMNRMLNHWLLYQDLSCRLWGRSALYQSSGAYGFRDQLQDVMALVFAAPEVTRRQIIRSAHHQFEAGDVLHWWHPPSGRGVRTRISDDLLWLPYVTAEYLHATGDMSILQEKMPFLSAPPLKPDEEDRYGLFPPTAQSYTLYEHCLRAIRKGATAGAHRLPLFGAGDWNDGMNRVGIEGKGESVWLGWFLYAVLERFEPVCRAQNDDQSADEFQKRAADLRAALHESAWDGGWYLRGFYDSGQPLGSKNSMECKIDSIAQSWALLSGAGQPERDRQGMDAVLQRLVQRDGRLMRLFTPPFNHTPHDPGYIKAYPPGIRENGGQYTHAAIWSVWAFTLLQQGSRAVDLFRLLNPISHASTTADASVYRVEPYVVAADVYSVPPHIGRGGWTWYTGSAGWMYRLGIEAILGIRRAGGDRLAVDPCIPPEWDGFEASYRYGKTLYRIHVQNPRHTSVGVGSVHLDGQEQPNRLVPLADDGREHDITIRMDPGADRLPRELALIQEERGPK